MRLESQHTNNCFDCNEENPIEELFSICEECFEKRMLVELVQQFVEKHSNRDYLWTDKEHFIGFNNESEKEIFMNGIKYGVCNSLFWMCDFFGLQDFFEEKIHDKFYPEKK